MKKQDYMATLREDRKEGGRELVSRFHSRAHARIFRHEGFEGIDDVTKALAFTLGSIQILGCKEGSTAISWYIAEGIKENSLA